MTFFVYDDEFCLLPFRMKILFTFAQICDKIEVEINTSEVLHAKNSTAI